MAVDATPSRPRDPRRDRQVPDRPQDHRSARGTPRGSSAPGVGGRGSTPGVAPAGSTPRSRPDGSRPSSRPGGSSRQGSGGQGSGTRQGGSAGPAGLDPAGRHANGVGDGFGRLIGFTVLGAAVPGAGLVAAGRRRTGWTIVALLVAVVVAAVGLVLSGRATALGLRFATNPDVLLGVAVGVGVLAAAWCAIIVVSHLALRRRAGTGGQRAVAVLLVAALMGLVALPAATASRYALSARSSLITVFNAGGAPAKDRAGAASPDTQAADPWAEEPRVNVMLLGSDHDAQHTGIRPDTLIVASIDTRTGNTTLISLPRNLQKAPFPPGSEGAKAWPDGFGSSTDGNHILNAVWAEWGQAHPEYFPDASDPGLAATASVVSTIIGMPVDYSVVINLDGFQEVVNAMGGLTLNVPRRLPIGGGKILTSSGADTRRTYPVDGYVEAGRNQLLDGYQAVWFARSRSDSDDNERINRQRCVLQAAVQQYTPLKIAQAFPAIAATANRNIETDIRADQIPAFVTLGQRIKGGNLTSLAFTQAVVDTTDPDYPKMRDLVQQALLTSDGQAQPTQAPSSGASTSPTPSPSGSTDVLAAPKGSPIVDPATVCG